MSKKKSIRGYFVCLNDISLLAKFYRQGWQREYHSRFFCQQRKQELKKINIDPFAGTNLPCEFSRRIKSKISSAMRSTELLEVMA